MEQRTTIRTERRTSVAVNITFVGWNGTWKGDMIGKSANYGNSAYGPCPRPCRFAKDPRKRMGDFDYGTKAVDQVVIFVPIVFELLTLFLEELVCGRMFGEVHSSLPGITRPMRRRGWIESLKLSINPRCRILPRVAEEADSTNRDHQIRSGADDSTSW